MNEYQRTAGWLHALGFNVTAIAARGKKPGHKWEAWQTARQTPDEVRRLPWRGAAGVGVISGIGGWHAFDFDRCPEFAPVAAALDALGLPTDYRWVWRSGSHCGYGLAVLCAEELPAALAGKRQRAGGPGVFSAPGIGFDHLELRWRACQTVLPPSQHPSGPGYQWLHAAPDGPPAAVTAGRVLAAFLAVTNRQDGGRVPAAGARPAGDLATAAAALRHVDPWAGGYDWWVSMLMALHAAHPGADGLALAETWGDGKPGEIAAKWRSFTADGGLTIGTLYREAERRGWIPPWRAAVVAPAGADPPVDRPEPDLADGCACTAGPARPQSAAIPEARVTAASAVPALPRPGLNECPPLPDWARPDPALERDVSPWLDAYIAFSRAWSPQSWDGYHTNVALGILSTVAARRIRVDFGVERYTSLMLADVGRSSIWAKSTAQRIGRRTLQAAGLDFLLAADTTTPQALVARMAATGVIDWDAVPPEQREVTRLRLGFAGQRGWFADEFGAHIGGMMRSDGPLADFVGLLRVLDDGLERYETDTIARGRAVIQRPYLALLVSFTPADVARWAGRGGPLWTNGFWSRYSFSCPPPDTIGDDACFPDGPCAPPAELVAALRRWHEQLGVPDVEIVLRSGEDGKPLKERTWEARITPPSPLICTYSADVKEALYTYRRALRQLIAGFTCPDLDGSYSRFPERTLRVAALLAAFDADGHIDLRHWARAQAISEGWRQGLHNLYASINADLSEAARLEDQVLELVERLGGATVADLRHYFKGSAMTDIALLLDRLAAAGVLRATKTRVGTKRYLPNEPAR